MPVATSQYQPCTLQVPCEGVLIPSRDRFWHVLNCTVCEGSRRDSSGAWMGREHNCECGKPLFISEGWIYCADSSCENHNGIPAITVEIKEVK